MYMDPAVLASGVETATFSAVFNPFWCDHCNKMEEDLPTKLKRCAGCSAAKYCSRECQKAAWPSHKILCSRGAAPRTAQDWRVAPDQLPGFAAPATMVYALKTWADDIHTHTISILASTLVLLSGGMDAVMAPDSPHALLITVDPTASPDSAANDRNGAGDDDNNEPNPATRFKIRDADLVEKSKLGLLEQNWDRWAGQSQTFTDHLRQGVEDRQRTFGGMLPTALVIAGTGIVKFHHAMIHGQQHYHSGALHERDMKAAFVNIFFLCKACINAGLVFHQPEGLNGTGPTVGTYVRGKKKWKWALKEDWNWDDREFPGADDDTCLNPRVAWERWYGVDFRDIEPEDLESREPSRNSARKRRSTPRS
ncbi:hypothetical protein C8Q79DRAFT_565152 [Trametes meyenii]|nr:hypothetical protein C8Q79DRAFT_565152 [Trametes meyenii]